jgi:hypothetical protein
MPVYFRVPRELRKESGSLPTASTTNDSKHLGHAKLQQESPQVTLLEVNEG